MSDTNLVASDSPRLLSESAEKVISKNQVKKLAKRKRFDEVKLLKRQKERERRKQRLRECKQAGIDTGPSRKKLKLHKMIESNCKLRVALDCSFDHLMLPKDIIKLVKQIQHCYAINRRRGDNMVQLYVTSFGDQVKERFESISGSESWDIYMKSEAYECLFNKEECVYLTSESPNTLSEIERDKVYIIGGLVDHNNEKGLCYRLAAEKGIPHAKLPLDTFMDMKTRKVLTVDHVFDIIGRAYDSSDWAATLATVLPKRKEAVPRQVDTTEGVVTDNGLTSCGDTKDADVTKDDRAGDEDDSTCSGN